MATDALARDIARPRTGARTRVLDLRIGGTLLLLAGAAILLAIISAEALYPAPYTTGGNEISDLGGTRPPEGIVLQPSATIFNLSMLAVGLLVAVAAWFVQGGFGRLAVTVPVLVVGVAAFGVGLFPGDTGTPHALFAMATFVSGGIGALTTGLVARGPFRSLTVVLGLIGLGTLILYLLLGDASPMAALGIGGLERWIVYPIVIWLIAFGAYQLGVAEGGAEPAGLDA
ncbi:MAG TPA: DUF998 domain-containing protein [Candidatus Limnocylindrales bacterium]